MRNSPHVHERHLLEAIRQRVITQEQYEGIVAIVRSMAHADGETVADLGWLSVMQGLAAATGVGIPGLYLLKSIERFSPSEVTGWSLLGALLTLGAGLFLRRTRSSAIAASVLLAGCAAFTWGVAAGGVAQVLHADFWNSGVPALALVSDSHASLDAQLTGDLAVMLAASVLIGRLGAAAAAAPATLAFVHFAVQSVHRFAIPYDSYFGERKMAPFIAAAGLVAMLIARVLDRKYRGRVDAAFWVHTFGLLSLGCGLTTRIDREPGESLVWSLAALAVIAAGVRWNRRVYLLCGSLAWTFWPAMMFMHGSSQEGAAIGAFVFSAVTIAIMATWLRANWSRLAPAQHEVRTVWV